MDFFKIDWSKMSTEDKAVRLAAAGTGALLILLFIVRGFGDGVERSADEAADNGTEVAAAEEEATEEEATEEEAAEEDAETAEAPEQEAREEDMAEAEAPEEDAPEEAVEIGDEVETVSFDIPEDADIANGQRLFAQCSACHVYDAEQNRAGPHLVGIVGRDIAAADGWSYSDALLAEEGEWTPERLSAWLEDPDSYIPGNQMAYNGISGESDRMDLIAFLYAQQAD